MRYTRISDWILAALVVIVWVACAITLLVLMTFLLGCAEPLSPLAPTPQETTTPKPLTQPGKLDPSDLPPNDWWEGGFICGPDHCFFASGYRWETKEEYCADNPDTLGCDDQSQ